MTDFADVEIRIWPRQSNQYPVEIALNSQQEFKGSLNADVEGWAPSGDPLSDGQALFDLLFADRNLHRAWGTAGGQTVRRRIRLRIDTQAAKLHALPWELLCENNVVLAASADMPFSRYLPGERPWREPLKQLPIHVLVAISNPDDLEERYNLPRADLELERDALETAFSKVPPAKIHVEFLEPPATLSRMEDALRDGNYHVLHILSHGAFNARIGQAALYLQADDHHAQRVADNDFAAMLARKGVQPHLVVLAACQSATRSTADAFLGLGPKLIEAGVPAVVAMQDFVTVETARIFSGEFYRRLLKHDLVDLAVNEARDKLLTEGRPDAAVPVLFMRLKTGRLWIDVRQPDTSHPRKARWQWAVGLSLLIFLIALLLWLGQNGQFGSATTTPAASGISPATATLWPSPTPNLSDRPRILSADFAGCPSQLNFAETLENELHRLPADGRTIMIERTGQIADEREATASGEKAQAQLVIWGACQGQTVQLQVTFLKLPKFYELLFEPGTLQWNDRQENARQFAIVSSLYAYAQYEAADTALSLLLDNHEGGALVPLALYWLQANSAARRDAWSQAVTAYEQAVSTTPMSSTQALLYANLGLARLQVALSAPDKSLYCSQTDPAGTYSTAIDLAADLPALEKIIPLLYVGHGLAYLECPTTKDDDTILRQLQEDADRGITLVSPLAYDLRARIKEITGDRLGAQSDACAALSLDPSLPVPYRTLGGIYARYENLREQARAEFNAYGRLARFNWQREEARRRLEDLLVIPPEATQTPPGLGQCSTVP